MPRLPSLPSELINHIGQRVGYPHNFRQTARAFKDAEGNTEFNLLNQSYVNRRSVCFHKGDKALVKVQLLRALGTKFLEINLSSPLKENCYETFSRMLDLLKYVCDNILVLRYNMLGPSVMNSPECADLLKKIVTPTNHIQVLQVSASNVFEVDKILRNHPTLGNIQTLSILLPNVLVELNPGETAFSRDWLPNIIQQRIYDLLTSFEPSRYKRLKWVEIMRVDGRPLSDIKGMGDRPFGFGFEKDINGRIIDYDR